MVLRTDATLFGELRDKHRNMHDHYVVMRQNFLQITSAGAPVPTLAILDARLDELTLVYRDHTRIVELLDEIEQAGKSDAMVENVRHVQNTFHADLHRIRSALEQLRAAALVIAATLKERQ
jgi:hypothetical protein